MWKPNNSPNRKYTVVPEVQKSDIFHIVYSENKLSENMCECVKYVFLCEQIIILREQVIIFKNTLLSFGKQVICGDNCQG